MQKSDFYFDLPPELIAQYPLPTRSASRLLVYDKSLKKTTHHTFQNLIDLLMPGDLLVMNDSRVIPARLYGNKSSGGKIELLVERLLENNEFLAHIKASKSPKSGSIIKLNSSWQMSILDKKNDLYHCKVNGDRDQMLREIGHVPLPPYITRQDDLSDLTRYQTVYARHDGSVAAPTAGLHFDDNLIESLQEKGIKIDYLTLHVGAGTFRPVRTESIYDHVMHSEFFSVSSSLCESVMHTKSSGGRVIAVGTTAMRSLESAAASGKIEPSMRDTDIFIFPGYNFRVCDGLITNFHLPESTLLMLVSAFIGYEQAMNLYKLAVDQKYRFFSYGDASLLY